MEIPKFQLFVVGIFPCPSLCVSLIVIVQFQVIQDRYRNTAHGVSMMIFLESFNEENIPM